MGTVTRLFLSLALGFVLISPVVAQETSPEGASPSEDTELGPVEPTPQPPEQSPVPTATLVPTPTPTAQPTPAPGPGSVLLTDNFDDPSRAQLPLETRSPDFIVQGYVEGEYMIRQVRPQTAVAVPLGFYGDTSIAVDARIVGPSDSPRGVYLSCRGTDQFGRAGYWFVVDTGGGFFTLRRFGDGANLALERSSAIRPGNATNRLELNCVGSRISATINGTQVVSVEDGTYREGRAWIGVGFNNDAGARTEARFDNLVVTQR